MAKSFDICIRGAGIVGRTLALQLASKRLRVALQVAPAASTSHSAHSDVRAYALNQASRDLLESVRCWPDATYATAVQSMQVHGDEGGSVSFSAASQGVPALNWIVDVPTVEKLLEDAVRFQPLIELVTEPQVATLTVVCEGRTSATRDEFGVEFDAVPYGQSALAARVECDFPHGQIARQWFAQGEILALLPMGGAQGNLCALVWSVLPERALTLQNLSTTEFDQALTEASHQALGQVRVVSERKSWPLQHAQAKRWSGNNTAGAWVLAGDAAHNVHPLAGQGLNLGLGDVAALVDVLDTKPYWRPVSDPRLLRHYERSRKAEFAMIGNTGDALQRLFNHNNTSIQALRNWGMNGFERSGAVKHWIAQRAMGTEAASHSTGPTPSQEPT